MIYFKTAAAIISGLVLALALAATGPAQAQSTTEMAELDPALIKLGKRTATRKGCASCHSTDGKKRAGPSWKGLFGTERELTDGSVVIADEEYLRESVYNPRAKVLAGFPEKLMPTDYEKKIDEEAMQALIAYIESLK